MQMLPLLKTTVAMFEFYFRFQSSAHYSQQRVILQQQHITKMGESNFIRIGSFSYDIIWFFKLAVTA